MERGDRKKRGSIVIVPICGMVIGLLLLLYPFVLDQYNEYRNEQAISSMSAVYDRYEDQKEIIENQLKQADAYNARLAGNLVTEQPILPYEEQMTFEGNGVIGAILIPKINVKMKIYHGTEDNTLAVGVGHLEDTSLPVGGDSTHTVLTAHSGMKTMRAFDDIRKLEAGDLIQIIVPGRQLMYEVESTETVLPNETESLKIQPSKDYLTLVTCTPYGINDHRLLVHAVRSDQAVEEKSTTEIDSEKTEVVPVTKENSSIFTFDLRTTPLLIAVIICAGVTLYVFVKSRKDGKE